MSKRFISSILSLGLAVSMVSSVQASHRDESGIKGKVKQVVCETNRAGTRIDCDDEYVQATVIVQRTSGEEVLRFTTTSRGKFEVNLPQGTYKLVSANPALTAFPSMVTVNDGDFAKVKLYLNGPINLSL